MYYYYFMREIKFRAWDKKRKEIIPDLEDHFIVDSGTGFMLCFGEPLIKKEYQDTVILQEDLILMQYTGLKDKNKKEIYEGDIVKSLAFTDVVVFDQGIFTTKRSALVEFSIKQPLAVHSMNYMEVIGNIYENPELMEAKE